ncbi:MAG: hypothetical protein ACOH2F_12190 [Cellulomonas sp.]
MTRANQKRAEDLTDVVFWAAGVFYVLAGFVPVILIMIIGIINGTSPDEADGGLWGVAPGYPAFDPQSWLFFLPALALLFLSLWTIPLPLRSFPGTSRAMLAWTSAGAVLLTAQMAAAFQGAPGIANEGIWAALIFAAAAALFFVRLLLGALHLLPRTWREADPTPRRRRKTVSRPRA